MPEVFRKLFDVTGVANDVVYDVGIESTEAEPKHIVGIELSVSGDVGNVVQVWVERDKKQEVPDVLLDTWGTTGSTNVQYSTHKINKLDVDFDLPVGERLRVALLCGATATKVRGCYVYNLI